MSSWATIYTEDDGTGNDIIDVARNTLNPGFVRLTLIDWDYVELELPQEAAVRLARALLEAAYP